MENCICYICKKLYNGDDFMLRNKTYDGKFITKIQIKGDCQPSHNVCPTCGNMLSIFYDMKFDTLTMEIDSTVRGRLAQEDTDAEKD